MALEPNTRLGPYEIVSLIGAGGMGEVYKASDSRLNRTVAIKVLPPHFSDNLEMKQRFEREAQTVAGLNHPNICTLYDVGEQDGVDFLVMEYLEGETLAERLKRGPLPIDEALKAAVAIGDALDKAHQQGVTHRDLKPANVMLVESGPKLLDFGLAKLRGPSSAPIKEASSLPTRDIDATAPGTILGTMQYMAPEQLEGKEADARTDIFAFGAVLYEMVTAKKAFEGKSRALLISSIMSSQPQPLSKAQPMAPPALEYLVGRCLAKDPEQRVQTAWDLMGQLQWISEGGSQIGIPAPLAALRRRQARLAWTALVVPVLLAAAMAVPTYSWLRSSREPEEVRFLAPVPDMPSPEAISVSPDGKWIAFAGRDSGSSALFTRPIDAVISTRLVGTEGVSGSHFWSPDSRTIAFFSGGKLKRIDAAGGAASIICDTPDMQGGSWSKQDMVIFASSRGLFRVLAAGGDPVPLEVSGGSAQDKKAAAAFPYFLPDDRHFLFQGLPGEKQESAIYVGSLDSKDKTKLISAQSNGVYAEPGYVLYQREGTLFAAPFNTKSLSLTGDAIRVGDRVPANSAGAGAFGASLNGVLVYRSNPDTQGRGGGVAVSSVPPQPLLWVDNSGAKIEQLPGSPASYFGVDASPDGKRVAAHRHTSEGGDIWIFERGTVVQFTFAAAQDNSSPIWSPDGSKIAFGSRRNGKWGLYVKASDNSRGEELLFESDQPIAPMSWAPDNKFLVYWSADPKTSGDIFMLPFAGEKKPIAILNSPADERNAQISPNGKWMAYNSNETGRSEVYIRPFPEGSGGKWKISANGGLFPRWRRDGKELYFLSLVSLGNVMASGITETGSSIQRSEPHAIFQSGYTSSAHAGGMFHPYLVSPDGKRFLIPRPENVVVTGNPANRTADRDAALADAIADRHAAAAPAASSSAPITVVVNWPSRIRK